MDVDTKDVGDTISLSPYRPGTHLRICPAPPSLVKTHYSLFAISNVFGWAIVVISSGLDSCSGPAFLLTRVDDLQCSIDQAEDFSTAAFSIQDKKQTILVPTAPFCPDPSVFITHAAFAAWDRLIVLATSNGALHIFSLYALIDQQSTAPLRSIHPDSNVSLKMLVPNPSKGGPLSGVIALVYTDGTIKVVDCYDTQKIYWTSQLVTAAEWSPMGKRLLVGYNHGRLEFLTHDGISKGKIDSPEHLEKDGLSVLHIKWLDQKNYIVSFTPTADQSDELTEVYCLNVPKQSEPSACTFVRVVDAITSDGATCLPPELLTLAISVDPQTNWKHISISSFTNSTSLTLLGYDKSDKPFYLDLEEGRPEIPVTEEDYAPSAPLGLALSYCTRQKSPLIWCYTTDGVLSLWKLSLTDPSLPKDLEVWTAISDFSDISAEVEKGIQEAPSPSNLKPPKSGDASATSQIVTQPLTASQTSGFSSFAASSHVAFGQPSLAFGQPSLSDSQTSLGSLPSFAKPSTSTTSGFGSFVAPTSVAFGQSSLPSSQTSSGPLPSSPKPMTSTASAFGSFAASSPLAFGQSSNVTPFCKPSLPTNDSTSSETVPQAAAASTASGFGSFAASTPMAFGQSSLTNSKTSSGPDPSSSKPPTSTAFGFGSFAASTPVAFGQPSLANSQSSSGLFSSPAKLATSTPSGFSSFASNNATAFPAKDDSTSSETVPQAAAASTASGFSSFAASTPVAFGQSSLTNSKTSSGPHPSSSKPPTSTAFGFGSFAASTPAAFGQSSLANSQSSSGLFSSPAKLATATPSGFGSFASNNVTAFGKPSPAKDPSTTSGPVPQAVTASTPPQDASTPPKDASTSSDTEPPAPAASKTSGFSSFAASTPVGFGQLTLTNNQTSSQPPSSLSGPLPSSSGPPSSSSDTPPSLSGPPPPSSGFSGPPPSSSGSPSSSSESPLPSPRPPTSTPSGVGPFASSNLVTFGQLSVADPQTSLGSLPSSPRSPTSIPSPTSPKPTTSTPLRASSKSPTSTLSPVSSKSSTSTPPPVSPRSPTSAPSTPSPQSATSTPSHTPPHTPPHTPHEENSSTPPTSSQKPPFLTTRPELILPMTSLSPKTVPKIIVDSTETFPDVTGKERSEVLSAITDLITSEIDCLAPVGLVCRRYLKECHKKLQREPSVADLLEFENWAFGDLSFLYQFFQHFAEHSEQKKAEYKSRYQAVVAFESVTIKGDMKLDEIKRLWRLRSDPGFSQVIRSRQLGPVQLAHQKDMRRLIRDVKHGISQMSEVLQSFDSRRREANSCRNRMQTPSLDMINRCIRCITLGFTQHIIDLEKMYLRVRQHKFPTSSLRDKSETLTLDSGQTHKGASRTPDQAAAVRALLSEHKGAILKESILKYHTEPILTQAQTLDQLNPTGESHGLSHIGIARTIIIKPRYIT